MAGARLVTTLLVICFINVIDGNVIVNTSSGKVEGVKVSSILKDEKFYSFFGIPYGQAPVGELRFMPPLPHPGWSDTLDAKKEKWPCAQNNFPMRKIKNAGFCGKEDCLHLNIHTPKLPTEGKKEKLPVIVFLYNEHFRVSHNGTKNFGPDFFMKEDVLLVMIHHRLGALGFLSFEDDLLPGNNGIRDVILALKWLKQNIHHFGGDSNKVTLMGNHEGAGLIDILIHSSKSKGLFSAAILQSGTSFNPMYFYDKPRERAIKYSEELEEKATTSQYLLKRLRGIDAVKLIDAERLAIDTDESRIKQRAAFMFGPIIEHDHPDAIITKFPEEGPLDIDIPIMVGYNSREALEMSERFLTRPQYLTFADRDFVVNFPLRTNYYFRLQDKIYNNAIMDIKKHYFDEAYIKISKPGEFITYLQDTFVFYPIDYTVRKYSNESKADIFYYMFDYSGEFNMRKDNVMKMSVTIDGTWGASAGDNLCYLFVCQPIKKVYVKALNEGDSEELKVLINMVRLWTNFAKTRNPTPPGEEFTWTPASNENKECLVITDKLQMKSRLHEDNVKFWDDFINNYRKLAVNGVVQDVKDEL